MPSLAVTTTTRQPKPPILDADEWAAIIINQIDGLPGTIADAADPYFVGALEAQQGKPCEPLTHYVKLGDIEQYIIGWRDVTEATRSFSPGQHVMWQYEPIGLPMRVRHAVVEEVGAKLVTIRIQGPDGDHWRKVRPEKIFPLRTERR